MLDALAAPWPWYVAGPLIGLIVPLLLLVGGKVFGISANLRHMCAATPAPTRLKPSFLRYDWKKAGSWNLVFILGVALGGFLAVTLLGMPDAGSPFRRRRGATWRRWGSRTSPGWCRRTFSPGSGCCRPRACWSWGWAGSWWASVRATRAGARAGHAISGLADLQLPSLVAVLGFFAGGLLVTFGLLPLILG
jgi:uncharacterized protein